MTSARSGRGFWKMSGSGNDFVFFDSRGLGAAIDPLETSDEVSAICRPHIGIGADGVVFIVDAADALFGIRYYNADGSRATLCGNASLCAAQSAVKLGLASREQMFHFMSDAGRISASIDARGAASVRLAAVSDLEVTAPEGLAPREQRIGYAVVGVPHLVVLVADVTAIDVAGRGRILRYGTGRAPAGANVNFVSLGSEPGTFRIRTYERGVEAETYACGTGAVATAACLIAWELSPAGSAVRLRTASDRVLTVRLPDGVDDGWSELSGEGRTVFDGVLRDYR
ncbi:MAG: diaminopimelate epimerase [Gemmatimonadaceae bacterium]|nr:diaminopimelate epimerase [Gemmatimonadaceae bacterium]